ncbi:hypothetical protein [Streptomyces sp. BH105]|uniref:hypothetical protein n=1 Tax=Streptomyces sp. BH105 TaxID=3410408 RepID=UPI003CF6D68A
MAGADVRVQDLDVAAQLVVGTVDLNTHRLMAGSGRPPHAPPIGTRLAMRHPPDRVTLETGRRAGGHAR